MPECALKVTIKTCTFCFFSLWHLVLKGKTFKSILHFRNWKSKPPSPFLPHPLPSRKNAGPSRSAAEQEMKVLIRLFIFKYTMTNLVNSEWLMYEQGHSLMKEVLWDSYYKNLRYNLILTGNSLMSHTIYQYWKGNSYSGYFHLKLLYMICRTLSSITEVQSYPCTVDTSWDKNCCFPFVFLPSKNCSRNFRI